MPERRVREGEAAVRGRIHARVFTGYLSFNGSPIPRENLVQGS